MAHGLAQGFVRAGAFNKKLAHVADVKKTCMLAGVLMLDNNTLILDGHKPPGKGGHFCAMRLVPGSEGGTQIRHGISLKLGKQLALTL